jgi:hypothetical protein
MTAIFSFQPGIDVRQEVFLFIYIERLKLGLVIRTRPGIREQHAE